MEVSLERTLLGRFKLHYRYVYNYCIQPAAYDGGVTWQQWLYAKRQKIAELRSPAGIHMVTDGSASWLNENSTSFFWY